MLNSKLVLVILATQISFSSFSLASSCAIFQSPQAVDETGRPGYLQRAAHAVTSALGKVRSLLDRPKEGSDFFLERVAHATKDALDVAEASLDRIRTISEAIEEARREGEITSNLREIARELSISIEGLTIDTLGEAIARELFQSGKLTIEIELIDYEEQGKLLPEKQALERRELVKLRKDALENDRPIELAQIDARLETQHEQLLRLGKITDELLHRILNIYPLPIDVLQLIYRIKKGEREPLETLVSMVPGEDRTDYNILTYEEIRSTHNRPRDVDGSHFHNILRPAAFKSLNAIHPLLGLLAETAARDGAQNRFRKSKQNLWVQGLIASHLTIPIEEVDNHAAIRADVINAARIYFGEYGIPCADIVIDGKLGLEISATSRHPLGNEALRFQDSSLRATGSIPENYPSGIRIVYMPDAVPLVRGGRSDFEQNIIFLSHYDLLRLDDGKLRRDYLHERDHHFIVNRDLWFGELWVGDRQSKIQAPDAHHSINGIGYRVEVADFETRYRQTRRVLEALRDSLVDGTLDAYKIKDLREEVEVAFRDTHFIGDSLLQLLGTQQIYSDSNEKHNIAWYNFRFILDGTIRKNALPIADFDTSIRSKVTELADETIPPRLTHYEQALELIDRGVPRTAEDQIALYRDLGTLITEIRSNEIFTGELQP